jgi:hypothetical protein
VNFSNPFDAVIQGPPRRISEHWMTTLPPHVALKYDVLNPNFILATEATSTSFHKLLEKTFPMIQRSRADDFLFSIITTLKNEATYVGILRKEPKTQKIDGIQLEEGQIYDPWYRPIGFDNLSKAESRNHFLELGLRPNLYEFKVKTSIEGQEVILYMFVSQEDTNRH